MLTGMVNSGVMHNSWRQPLLMYVLALTIVVLDQLTKGWAESALSYAQPVTILPVLDFTLLYNTGAAFSFLSEAGGWQRWFFTVLSTVVSVVLAVWIARLGNSQRLLAFAIGCILGGAIGNLWDRVALGHVVDFISVHWNDSYFPAFNLADSAITLGAGLLILDVLIHPEQDGGDKREN